MCYEFEYEHLRRRAEQAREEMKKAEERAKQPKPAAPAEAQPGVKELEPLPV